MTGYDEHLISMAGGDGEPEPLDLDAIQARADAATEGPWEAHQDRLWIGDEEFEPLSVAKFVTKPGVTEVHYVAPMVNEPEDQEFIAHARTDVPALLALVRGQQARIERVRELHVLHEDSGKCAECTVSPYSMHSVKWPCPTIAALTATEGA